jgi:hypothetical protein
VKHANGWERKRPAGWKPPFHYSIHNQAFIARVLVGHWEAAKAKLDEREANTGVKVLNWSLPVAMKSVVRRHQKFCGNTSKYAPHQGEREKLRRKDHRRVRLPTPEPSLR